ncbi:MAG TPA: hypothetical protein VG942_12255 [Hyphomonadaceae bacterium]|nr:hypothetical protein [Hyphomonadaceae bacterium]
MGDHLRRAVAALALASAFCLTACERSQDAAALERLPEAAKHDLYCSWAVDAAARRPFRADEDAARMRNASDALASAARKAPGVSESDARKASSALKEQAGRDYLQYTLKYSVDDCLARSDELAGRR